MADIVELGKKVKAKYPGVYDNLSDIEVGRRVKQKYPEAYGQFEDVKLDMPGPAAPTNVVKPITSYDRPTTWDMLTGQYAADADKRFQQEVDEQAATGDPQAVSRKKAVAGLRKIHAAGQGLGAGMLSAAAGGAGPIATMLSGAAGAATNSPETRGGVGHAGALDVLLSAMGMPSKTKLDLAKRGILDAAAFVGGQKSAGQEVTPKETAGALLTGALLPPAIKGGAEAIITNPAMRSLYMRSKNALSSLQEMLGLTGAEANIPVTENIAAAADKTKKNIVTPVQEALLKRAEALKKFRASSEQAAEQAATVRGNRAELLGARDAEQQARQRVLSSQNAANQVEKELTPIAQQQADTELANRTTNALNQTMMELVQSGHPISDVRGIPKLLVLKNPALAEALVKNPSQENIDAAIHMYNVDRAENIYKRLLVGRNPNNYEEMLEPETARIARAVLENPTGVPANVLDKYYKPQLNKLLPPYMNNIEQVQTLAEEAMRRNLAAKVNINPPPSPEVKALSGINRTYNATLKPGTAIPDTPPEVSQARQGVTDAEQALRAAQDARQAKQTVLTDAERQLGDLQTQRTQAMSERQFANTGVQDATRNARTAYEDLGVSPSEVDRLRQLNGVQPQVFYGKLAEGGEQAQKMARTALKVVGDDPETRTALTAGTLSQMVDSAKDAKGNIRSMASVWEKNRGTFRELLGDEEKVDKMGRFFQEIQDAENKLQASSSRNHFLYMTTTGLAAGLGALSGNSAAAPFAVASGTMWAYVKWPQLINAVLENPAIGKQFAIYAEKAGTQAGTQALRNILAWASKNGSVVRMPAEERLTEKAKEENK